MSATFQASFGVFRRSQGLGVLPVPVAETNALGVSGISRAFEEKEQTMQKFEFALVPLDRLEEVLRNEREIIRRLADIKRELNTILRLEIAMADVLDTVEADLTAETDAGDAMMNLLGQIKAALDAAGTDKTRLAALSTKIGANTARWTAATLVNTPAAEQAPEVPPVTGGTTA